MKGRIADIEVLRAVAVLAVLFQHVGNLLPWAPAGLERLYGYLGGSFGVDLFFAVSGFVIARDLVPRLLTVAPGQTRRVVLAFWVRRIWRLWPSAWLWLGLILVAVVAFNRSGAFGSLQANLEATAAGVLQYANVRFAQNFMVHEIGASFVYWSLSLEEQFYLLFPLLILLCRRRLAWCLLAFAAVQLAIPRQQSLLMLFRTDALVLGVLIALWSGHPTWRAGLRSLLGLGRAGRLALAGLALLAMALLCSRLELTRYAVSLIALLSAGLVLLASYDRDLLLADGRLRRALLWTGSRSYALYLIHIPVFLATRELFFRLLPDAVPGPGLALLHGFCALALLVGLAEVNYRLVEAPLRLHGARVSARWLRTSSTPPAAGPGPDGLLPLSLERPLKA
ncbi:acyltransferase family protein [Pseudomonas mangiferae]|uniref:Acyltransferase n=1 Tax=Pseudomonas mangiferae TaxID=2593654 RepID=A0A553GVC3_9PSED|nr:acyltransferase [Pseudomonas mangiferae]TRX73396.1 acyltransferase [Pseudomonas mangiferae]